MFQFYIHHASIMHTACIQHADAQTNVLFIVSVDLGKHKLSDEDYKHCSALKDVYEGVAVQCGIYYSMEFEATKAYVTDNGDFTIF